MPEQNEQHPYEKWKEAARRLLSDSSKDDTP